MNTTQRVFCLVLALASTVATAAPNETESEYGHLAKGPAAIALILFLMSFLLQLAQWWRNGRKGLLILLVGMFAYMIGMGIRLSGNYAWQFIVTFISPCAFLAANYVIFTRLASAVAAVNQRAASDTLVIPRRAISWIFILSDMVTFCTQITGTVFVILGGKWLSLGEALAISGLAIALVSYSSFILVAWIFARRLRKLYPELYHLPSAQTTLSVMSRFWSTEPVNDVRLLLRLLAISCVGIIIRSVFRLIEQSTGFFGPIARQEAYFYIFDALPLLISMTIWAIVWPKRFFVGVAKGGAEGNSNTCMMGMPSKLVDSHVRDAGPAWSSEMSGGRTWNVRPGQDRQQPA